MKQGKFGTNQYSVAHEMDNGKLCFPQMRTFFNSIQTEFAVAYIVVYIISMWLIAMNDSEKSCSRDQDVDGIKEE